VYYTTEWETARGGTTRFVDAKSGAIVTIQESEIREVDQKEFQQNTTKKKAAYNSRPSPRPRSCPRHGLFPFRVQALP
jgi:hypothetical protein